MSEQNRDTEDLVRKAAKNAAEMDQQVFVTHVVEQTDIATMNQAVTSRLITKAIATVEDEGWQLTDIRAALSSDLKLLALMTFRPANGSTAGVKNTGIRPRVRVG